MNIPAERARSQAAKAVNQSAWNRRSMASALLGDSRRGGLRLPGRSPAVPFDELLDAAVDGRGRAVAQLGPGPVDRGRGDGNVAGLERQVPDPRLLPQRPGDQLQD